MAYLLQIRLILILSLDFPVTCLFKGTFQPSSVSVSLSHILCEHILLELNICFFNLVQTEIGSVLFQSMINAMKY